MESIGAFEAKTRFSELLDRAGDGERITITKRGEPKAMLVPIERNPEMTPAEAVEEIRRLRKNLKHDDGLTVRELIDYGRNY